VYDLGNAIVASAVSNTRTGRASRADRGGNFQSERWTLRPGKLCQTGSSKPGEAERAKEVPANEDNDDSG
jgi:hypothetical protein